MEEEDLSKELAAFLENVCWSLKTDHMFNVESDKTLSEQKVMPCLVLTTFFIYFVVAAIFYFCWLFPIRNSRDTAIICGVCMFGVERPSHHYLRLMQSKKAKECRELSYSACRCMRFFFLPEHKNVQKGIVFSVVFSWV